MDRRIIVTVLSATILTVGASTSSIASELHSDLSMRMFYPALFGGNSRSSDPGPRWEPTLSSEQSVDVGKVLIVGGLLAGSMVAIHVYQQNGWWADNRASFHFQEDLTYGLWVDKIGHFYGATVFAYAIQQSLEWGNVPPVSALWWGSGGALLIETYVEMEDGFSTWGFDRVDFAFDVAGAAWPIARHYVPYLNNFDLKFSYHSSPLLGEKGGVGFRGQKHLMFDDYEGQTFWLSVKMHNLLPEPVDIYWPDFLCLAVGYGARDIATPDPYPVVFISADLDMTKIIPPTTSFLTTLGEALNFIHIPMPAVRVSPGVVWYGLYF